METEGHPPGRANSTVTVYVNGQPVKLHGKVASGHRIKTSAIEQGRASSSRTSCCRRNFPTEQVESLGTMTWCILHEHLRFTAIAPDDNS